MIIEETAIADVKIVIPQAFNDHRGYFFESYNTAKYAEKLGAFAFCQDNESLSEKDVIRGLHFQLGEFAQSKLIRCVHGSIWDVAVDLRRSSPTFRRWTAVQLSSENRKQLLVPKGFAHGFIATTPLALVQYKVDSPYSALHDRGIRFDDPELGISWPLTRAPILSAKDSSLPFMCDAEVFA